MKARLRGRWGVTCTMIGGAGVAIAASGASAGGCVSSNNPAASGNDSGPLDYDSAIAQQGQDAGTDSTVPAVDSGTDAAPVTSEDAGVDTGTDAGCSPRSIAAFMPPPYIHGTGESINPCEGNTTVTQTLALDCFADASTYPGCASFATTGEDDAGVAPTCLSCLISPEGSDAGYGAMIQTAVLVPNLAGCIEGADPTDAGLSCAVAIQQAWECAEFACNTACPVSDGPSQQAYIACTKAAAAGVCATYTTAATTCIAAERAAFEDAGSSAFGAGAMNYFCLGGTTPETQAADIAAYFCAS